MRTTIKDIAAKTGLSVTTVSLVLNNRPSKISQETRELVLKTAQELCYRPNQLAVGLIKKRTKTIGLILSDIRNSFFSTLAKGVEDECWKNGWTVFLCNTSDLHERDMAYIDLLASKGVDGIIYCMSMDSDVDKFQESQTLLHRLNLPYVMLDRTCNLPGISSVKVDHFTGGLLATRHLLELGHREIACVTGPTHLEDSMARLEGYKAALEEWDVPFDPSLLQEGSYDMASGIAAMEALIPRRPSAVFAFNDMMAYGVYKALKHHGLSIPRDISVVGYDDIFSSEILEVPLTSIHQPVRRMGAAAVRKLLSIIEKEPQTENAQLFLPELVIRRSTAPLSAR